MSASPQHRLPNVLNAPEDSTCPTFTTLSKSHATRITIFPALLAPKLVTPQLFSEDLAHARKKRCAACVKHDFPCMATNLCTWKCFECFTRNERQCDWLTSTSPWLTSYSLTLHYIH